MEEDLEDEEEEEVDVFPKPMAERFLLRLEHLQTQLQLTLSDVGGPNKTCNVSVGYVVSGSVQRECWLRCEWVSAT